MNFWKDYLRQVFPAFWHALAITDTLVIGVFILAGISAAAFGLFGGHGEHPAWWIALAIFLVSLLVLLIRIPYRLYAQQRTTINTLNDKLGRITEDRPLSFTGLSIEHCVQARPPYGPWIIDRIELGFENMGDQRISWTITEFFYENGGGRSPIPLPAGAGRYCLLARYSADYGFDVPGLQIQLQALVPTIFRVRFGVEYDNIPPLNVRRVKRVLECSVRSLRPMDYEVNIIEQVEC
jgi:hypothetical protein